MFINRDLLNKLYAVIFSYENNVNSNEKHLLFTLQKTVC